MLYNAASAKVRKGVAKIFCRSGRAGDDVVDRETACAEAKASGFVNLAEPCPWDRQKDRSEHPSGPKRRIDADTVGQYGVKLR